MLLRSCGSSLIEHRRKQLRTQLAKAAEADSSRTSSDRRRYDRCSTKYHEHLWPEVRTRVAKQLQLKVKAEPNQPATDQPATCDE